VVALAVYAEFLDCLRKVPQIDLEPSEKTGRYDDPALAVITASGGPLGATAGVTFGPCMAARPGRDRSRGFIPLVIHLFTLFLSLYISILSRKKIGIKALR
jgi:hypothetical protein